MDLEDIKLPADWRIGTLADLCSIQSDHCDPGKTNHTIYVGLEHIDPGAFTSSRYGTPKDVVSAKSQFRKGDILYGKLRPYLDKAVLADREGICSTDILVFRPHKGVFRRKTCSSSSRSYLVFHRASKLPTFTHSARGT